MVTLLSQAKETRLPHGLSGMVAQVFIVVVLDDGQQKPHNMSWILTKKGGGGGLLKDGTFGCHQALTDTITRKRHLGSYGLLSDGGHNHLHRLFGWTVTLIHQLPLYERLHLCCFSSKGHDPFQMLLRPFGDLFSNEGSPFIVIHFYAKGNKKRELDKNHSKRTNNE